MKYTKGERTPLFVYNLFTFHCSPLVHHWAYIMVIFYPRQCNSCQRFYKSRGSFCQHKPKCAGFTEILIKASSQTQVLQASTNNTMINNINNINNVDNSVTINVQGVTNPQNLSQALAPLLKQSTLSKSDLQCVEKVLLMLHNEGINTPQSLDTLIQEQSVTIQQLEDDIKNCCTKQFPTDDASLQSLSWAKQHVTKNDDREGLLQQALLRLFALVVIDRRLPGDETMHESSRTFSSNPLYISKGGMKVWSQGSGIKPDRDTKFGKVRSKDFRYWLLVQEDKIWRTIVDLLVNRLCRCIKSNETSSFNDETDTTEYIQLLQYFDKEGNTYMVKDSSEVFLSALIDLLKRELQRKCRDDACKGWHHLTDFNSKKKLMNETVKINRDEPKLVTAPPITASIEAATEDDGGGTSSDHSIDEDASGSFLEMFFND